jgi:hypothetical protein
MSTAPKARTLDAAPLSAGTLHRPHEPPVDIAHLKRVVSLAMVLSRYGILSQLKRVGSQLAGPCPVHDGSDPRQFVVHLASNNWFCFGACNRGGTMLDLVALKERVSIARAAEIVAEWFAIGAARHLPPRPRLQRRQPMSNAKPSHKVFIVENRENETDGEGGFWHRVGSAWPHKDGRGLNIQLVPGLAVSGRVVLREYTAEDEQREQQKAPKRGKRVTDEAPHASMSKA